MLIAIAALIFGFILIIWSADKFVTAASVIAQKLGVSTLMIGLTIVALGTSAPEIFVSLMAAIKGQPGLAIGNALGSNIANTGLVLGLTALVFPLTVKSTILRREYPIYLAVMLLTGFVLFDQHLSILDGILLVVALLIFLSWIARLSSVKVCDNVLAQEYAAEMPAQISNLKAGTYFILGLVLLPLSSHWIIYGAVIIAKVLGVSDLIIGLSIIALGTSLPEVATSLLAAKKHEDDIVIGNILGSNLFNLLAVLPLPAFIHPGPMKPEIFYRDFLTMTLLGILFFLFSYRRHSPGKIGRFAASVFCCSYFIYLGYLVVSH